MICLISVLIYRRKIGDNKVKHLEVIIKFLVDKAWSSLEP